MKSFFASVMLTIIVFVQAANAQQSGDDTVWVQVEAHPSLRVAQDRARIYAGSLPDVNGFSLGGSWYGIALGPYRRADAEQVLQVYRQEGKIPTDSYLAEPGIFGTQFWPVGASQLNPGAVAVPDVAAVTQPLTETPSQTIIIQSEPADETPSEARRSERLLSSDQRKDLQIALKSAGFYDASIDGAFGPGTRNSMAIWQLNNGFDDTGILTTRQRQVLLDQYNAPLISVGMAPVTDAKAGIQMQMPTKEVAFSRYEPPFAHYDTTTDSGIRLLLISQPGDRKTLYGLYDIMQTLEIVPLDGPRERKKSSFVLEGRNSRVVSYSEAVLEDGEIKGFTLIWPVGDEIRRTRVLASMRSSFARISGVLDPAAGADAEQNIDLVSGLEIRKPRLSRSGFFVDRAGTVITTAEAVQSCTRITLDNSYRANLVSVDKGLGIAVLKPEERLAPSVVAKFGAVLPRLKSQVIVSGYSFEGILGAPTLTFGKLEDVKGLRGEPELARLALAPLPGDAGGPVFDTQGSVLGMLLARSGAAQKLPDDVSFAADSAAISQMLSAAGLSPTPATAIGQITPDDLNRQATGMTVLVSCWD